MYCDKLSATFGWAAEFQVCGHDLDVLLWARYAQMQPHQVKPEARTRSGIDKCDEEPQSISMSIDGHDSRMHPQGSLSIVTCCGRTMKGFQRVLKKHHRPRFQAYIVDQCGIIVFV